jgi:hypothetical protein
LVVLLVMVITTLSPLQTELAFKHGSQAIGICASDNFKIAGRMSGSSASGLVSLLLLPMSPPLLLLLLLLLLLGCNGGTAAERP